MTDAPIVIFTATYDLATDARADYELVKQLHRDGLIGDFDAAIVTTDAWDQVHIEQRTETVTERGALGGFLAGAAVGGAAAIAGALFPPLLLAGGAAGALTGAGIEHLRKGIPTSDLRELGDMLNRCSAAIVVVAEPTVAEKLRTTLQRAQKMLVKQVNAAVARGHVKA